MGNEKGRSWNIFPYKPFVETINYPLPAVHSNYQTTTTYSSLYTDLLNIEIEGVVIKIIFQPPLLKWISFIHLVCPTIVENFSDPPLSTSHGPALLALSETLHDLLDVVVFHFVSIFPVLPYICLQSPTLVCPESSSPAHSFASFRKPECFSSCNNNTTLRFASTTTTTSTH